MVRSSLVSKLRNVALGVFTSTLIHFSEKCIVTFSFSAASRIMVRFNALREIELMKSFALYMVVRKFTHNIYTLLYAWKVVGAVAD